MKYIFCILIMVSGFVQAIDFNEHIRPEQFLQLGAPDKALVITDTRSQALNNRAVISNNYNELSDFAFDNYQATEDNKSGIAQNGYMITGNKSGISNNADGVADNAQGVSHNAQVSAGNTKAIGINRGDIDHNRYLIDNMQTGISNSYANTARINQLEDKVNESVALSSAFSALPSAYKGESVIGAGVGHFNGEDALAVGIEHSTGTWSFNAGVSTTRNDQAYKAGLGYHW